jgi:hypothetical protein
LASSSSRCRPRPGNAFVSIPTASRACRIHRYSTLSLIPRSDAIRDAG